MNITRTNKNKPEKNHLLKSFLVISANYKVEGLYNLLLKNPSLVNTRDQKNETFLSYAIKRKNIETSELILTSPKLDILYQDNNGNTYLHLAVINQLENIIRLLIKKGININLQNNDGNTALHLAYNTGNIKIIAVLIENNADLKIKNKDGLLAEEIKTDTLKKTTDDDNNNNNSNNSKKITSKNDDRLLTGEKTAINKTIQINWENNNENNKTNSSKNTLKYSLVNFTYSDDDNSENNDEKKYNTEKTKEKTENMKNSDIFDLASSLTYKEKVATVSFLNSHVVGSPNIFKNETIEDENDIVNIKKNKTSENKYIYDSMINNKKPNLNLIKCNTNNIYKRNIIEYNISKGKEKIDAFNNYEDNEKIVDNNKNMNRNKKNNKDDNNTITYHPDLNGDNFCFSPFITIKESVQKKKDINSNNNDNIETEKQQMFNNSLKNINISNSSNISNNNINNNYNLNNSNNNNNESLSQRNQNLLNSKSNLDVYSSILTADDTVNKSKLVKNSQDSLYIFLLEIKLEKYFNIMNSNGFDDVKVLINQMKSTLAVTDTQLKEAGIDAPGDRAKIIIRLQEKAGNFIYHIPKSVYHICNDLDNYMNDTYVKKLYEWLKPIKVENYIENFIDGGYHCVELMLLQMESKSPITDAILRDDLGITKIGHRARIINKLLEEGKKLNNKLKNSMVIVGNGKTEKICECSIF